MADEKKFEKEKDKNLLPKPGFIDLTARVVVTRTDKGPRGEKGDKITVSPQVAKKLIAKGWATGKVDETV